MMAIKFIEDIYFNPDYTVEEKTEEQIIIDAFLNYVTQKNKPYSYGEDTLAIFLFEQFIDKTQITDFLNSKLAFWLISQDLNYDIQCECFNISENIGYQKILNINFYIKSKEIEITLEVN